MWLQHSSQAACSMTNAQAGGWYCDVDGDPTADIPGYSLANTDAVLATAMGIDAILRDDSPGKTAVTATDGDLLYQRIAANSEFDGVSGPVALDASADRLGYFMVKNLQVLTSRRLSEEGEGVDDQPDAVAALPPRFWRRLDLPLSKSTASYVVVGSYGVAAGGDATANGVIFPGGRTSPPSDSGPASVSLGAIVGAVVGVVLLFVLVLTYQRYKANKKICTAG